MRKMKDSGVAWIGEIPVQWGVVYLSSIVSKRKHKNEGMKENNLLSLSYGNVVRKSINTSDGLLPANFEGYNIIELGDIVLRLTDLQNDHTSLRTGLCKEKGIITSAYVTLNVDNDIFSSDYLHYLMHSFDCCKGFYGMGSGVRQGLNYDGIKKIEILMPDKTTQQKIAAHLDRKCTQIDALISNAQQQIEKLKAYKQSVITETVTKGLDPDVKMKDSGVEWIGEIPEHWKIAKIKIGVTKVGSGKTPLGGAETYSSEGVLFLRSQNIYDEGINLDSPTYITDTIDEEMKGTRVKPYDVLLNITGGSIGRCCIFPPELERANVNQHVSIIRVIDSIFTPDYMHYYWNSNIGKMSISLYQTGGNREGMSADAIKNSPIMVIPIQEQKVITTYLDHKCSQIDKLIDLKQQKIEKLQQYKKSLIYEYVTGKKEV